jgi:hypothetical protein
VDKHTVADIYVYAVTQRMPDGYRFPLLIFSTVRFASLALIVNLASMLSKRQQNITDIKESLIPILFGAE